MPGDPTTSNELPEIRASVLLLLLFETCALLLRHYFQGQLLESGRSPSLARDVSWLLVPVTLLFLMWPILRINLTALGAALEIARINLRLIGQAISLGFVLWLSVASVLFTISAFRTGMVYGSAAYHQQPFLSCLPDGSMLLAVVVSVLLTPFVEELLNRGIILRGLIKHGKVFAILSKRMTNIIWFV
jgi:membrane protease YdiL (CAAX protease family)